MEYRGSGIKDENVGKKKYKLSRRQGKASHENAFNLFILGDSICLFIFPMSGHGSNQSDLEMGSGY